MHQAGTVVIGGGLAGLLAAIGAAQAGRQVVLLERSAHTGGRGISVHKNGARLNLGGHALYRGGAAYANLQRLGVKLDGGTPSTAGEALWKNGLAPLPADPFRLLTSKLFRFSGKIELGRLLMRLGSAEPSALGNVSLRQWAEAEVRDPMARHMFYSLCRTATYGRDIDYQLARAVLRQVRLALKDGVRYLDGGWQSLIDQLQALAVRSGVAIRTRASAEAIVHENGAVRGVSTGSGELIPADSVISTLPPGDSFRLVAGAANTALSRWTEDARPITAACLDLALRRLPTPGRDLVMGLDQPLFFSNHSRAAKLSDNGTIVTHLIKYNAPGEQSPQADEELLTRTMDMLHPGWEQLTAAKQFLPSITVVHDYPHIARRDPSPGPAVPEIRGLYVAGDWASHDEMLADAAAASAERAVAQLLKDAKAGLIRKPTAADAAIPV
ncbi:FAD-dependent oxidoreductase [Paenibacillus lycopersici]|uniref:FAD-dependent oxidoreductase n=1 Tax=Paenibacillus lycopersici TaxID=2704462 RepID=A0A6C0G2D3_9BACL|nr:FAD-dependent oxidoreductase [Paenibacillus lycopersici]QHT63628.1 FAD-dependent oxidoreductase [Paenibacillus lycopersici]